MNQRIKQQSAILCMGVLFLYLILRLEPGMELRQQIESSLKNRRWKRKQREQETQGESVSITETENPNIRGLICSDNYAGDYHDRVVLQCSGNYSVSYGDVVEEHGPEELVTIERGDAWLKSGPVTLKPLDAGDSFTMPELLRAYEEPVYAEMFQVEEERQEGLLVVNEVPLETYLCSVVPSEMPSSYPMEALKAQAICARTYARKQMEGSRGDDLGVDVDDSVSYQVYNNIPQN